MTNLNKRVDGLDSIVNRKVVAYNIIQEMVENGYIDSDTDKVAELVTDYLATIPLAELICIEECDVYATMRGELIDKFLGKYNGLTNGHSDVIVPYFAQFGNLNRLYEVCVVNERTSSTDFESYFNAVVPNVLPNYTFNVVVNFEVDNAENYTLDDIKAKIARRIGKGGKYKWGACELVGVVVAKTTINGEEYAKGVVDLHIEGNATYTLDTIKQAIYNRLGENAKKKKWVDFVVIDVTTK